MRSVLRALSGMIAGAGGCAVINMSTYAVCCMYECACKKGKTPITIFSGLYRFKVHCAKLEKKNNNSDNKLDLVIRNASIVILVCW